MPFDGECASEEARCFHCGEPNARDGAWRQVVSGVSRSFCCAGCAAIAQMIDGAGLADYYASRTAVAAPAAAGDEAWERYDVDGATQGLVVRLPDGACEVALLLEGIHCAACIWLVEGYLARQAGVLEVHVNFATRRARIRWDPTRARLSDVLRAIAALGYRAYPYDPQRREALARRESRACCCAQHSPCLQ